MNSFIKQNNNANTSRVGLEPIFFHSPNYTGGKIKDQPTLTAYKTRPNTPMGHVTTSAPKRNGTTM